MIVIILTRSFLYCNPIIIENIKDNVQKKINYRGSK